MKHILVFIVFISTFSANSICQEDILENFSLTQTGNSVTINFSIRGGASCNGVTLLRRLNSDTAYTSVDLIQGVCGGSEFTEHYILSDDSPLFGEENIYRLELGLQGFSGEKSITVIELVENYKIYPQPATEEIFIAFDNPNSEPVSLSVFDMNGRPIIRDASYNVGLIYLDGTILHSGMYVFQLSFEDSKMITGRFFRT